MAILQYYNGTCIFWSIDVEVSGIQEQSISVLMDYPAECWPKEGSLLQHWEKTIILLTYPDFQA